MNQSGLEPDTLFGPARERLDDHLYVYLSVSLSLYLPTYLPIYPSLPSLQVGELPARERVRAGAGHVVRTGQGAT